MKIKHLLLTFCCIGFVSVSYCQTSDDEADALMVLFGVQKKQAVAQLVSVKGKDSVAFWKIYDEYLSKNRETGKNRLKLYELTARSYGDMTPAVADSLATKYFSNRESQEKMLQDYYRKVKAATNATVAFEFYQAEVYILTQLRAQIMQQIPTYGQVMNSSRKN